MHLPFITAVIHLLEKIQVRVVIAGDFQAVRMKERTPLNNQMTSHFSFGCIQVDISFHIHWLLTLGVRVGHLWPRKWLQLPLSLSFKC